jgi:S-formylglutathione hydrolase FrmB
MKATGITAGNAVGALAGKGVSLVAPAGGAYTLYTDWERDGSKQWSTFLSTELPDWLAANRGLAPGGHAIVGASQGGTAALTLAESYPNRFRYVGSMSGFLYPSNTSVNGALHEGMMRYGGVDTDKSTPTICGVQPSWAAGSGMTPTSTCRR